MKSNLTDVVFTNTLPKHYLFHLLQGSSLQLWEYENIHLYLCTYNATSYMRIWAFQRELVQGLFVKKKGRKRIITILKLQLWILNIKQGNVSSNCCSYNLKSCDKKNMLKGNEFPILPISILSKSSRLSLWYWFTLSTSSS